MINKKLLSYFLVFFAIESYSQSYTDTQGRFMTSVDYKITKKLKISGEYRYSLQNDFHKFRSSAGEISLKYNFTKKLNILGGYRFTTSFEEDNHRFFIGIKYNKKWDEFKAAVTSKYQYSTNSFDPDFMNYYKEPVQMLREEISLDYDIPNTKTSVFIASEIFLKMNSQPYLKWNRMRYSIGGQYKLKYGTTLSLSTFYDDKVSAQKNDRIVIVTKLNVSIDDFLKKLKKNKKKALKKQGLLNEE
jgi:hypothetical protein